MCISRFFFGTVVAVLFFSANSLHADAWACEEEPTQSAMNICAYNKFTGAEQKVEAANMAILQRFADNPDGLALFNLSVKAWADFRDAECKFGAFGVLSGTVYPFILNQCMSGLTLLRAEALERELSCEEGDMSCSIPRAK